MTKQPAFETLVCNQNTNAVVEIRVPGRGHGGGGGMQSSFGRKKGTSCGADAPKTTRYTIC
eukprot:4457203-Amphidinium_carterae.1